MAANGGDRDHVPERQTRAPVVVRAIDRVNGWLGSLSAWLVVIMVVVGAFNAFARYLGRYIGVNLSSNAYLELQWYLFSLVFLLGGAWALRDGAHVRVDVFYERVSHRVRRWITVLGTLLLLLPFTVFSIWVAIPFVRNSWRVHEGSPDPGGLPRYPLKTMVIVGFALLALQGVSELVKALRDRGEPPKDGTSVLR
ncbi:MAG TPA: TRAP transporter small permease subunit [Longimicrobiales bacterium]|nr:TRAP transporter small permease subunit [Longimicrobiales bacterium]